jgi:hypothetical protein
MRRAIAFFSSEVLLLFFSWFLIVLHKNDPNQSNGMEIFSLTIIGITMLWLIPALWFTIVNLVQALRIDNVLEKETFLFEWEYSKEEWDSWVIACFRAKVKASIKITLLLVLTVNIIGVPLLYFFLKSKEPVLDSYYGWLFLPMVAAVAICLKNHALDWLILLENLKFTTRRISFYSKFVIVDGEIVYYFLPLSHSFDVNRIENDQLMLEGVVQVWKVYNSESTPKNLIIPIPYGRIEEASLFVEETFKGIDVAAYERELSL